MTYYNYIYSILCKHDIDGYRSVSRPITVSKNIEDLINILIPESCTVYQRAILAELYIKFIKTDASLNKKLMRVDPYNSYDVVQYDIIREPSVDVDLEVIAKNIKNFHISSIRYNDMIGYIIDGLEYLLDLCIG